MDPDMLLRLDQQISDFERRSDWRLSLPAKIVLQQAFASLATDHLGLKGLSSSPRRQAMQSRVLNHVDDFLSRISNKARDEVNSRNLTSEEQKLIGAIFVLQNINTLVQMIDCECWPG